MPVFFTPTEVRTYYATRLPKLPQGPGWEWRGKCPFCGDQLGNFCVNRDSGRCFCQKCAKGGDLLALEQSLYGVPFETAKQRVFDLIGRTKAECQQQITSTNGDSVSAEPSNPTEATIRATGPDAPASSGLASSRTSSNHSAPEEPSILPLNVGAIPADLRALRAWIGWRLMLRTNPRTKNPRWTKEPINLHTGGLAETDNPNTWVDFETAVKRYTIYGCDGIGLCRTGDLIFIDLDGVLDQTGNLLAFGWAFKILSAIQDRAYLEKSPSGTGIHGIARGKLPRGRRQFDDPYRDHTGFALYDASRFFAFTGSQLPESAPVCELAQEELQALHQELFPPRFESRRGPAAPPLPSPSLSLSVDELIQRAMGAKNGSKFARLWQGDFSDYPSQSEADLALCCHLAFWTGRDAGRIDDLFRQSALYRKTKWGRRQDYRERTIDLAIQCTTETWRPARATEMQGEAGTGGASDEHHYVHSHSAESQNEGEYRGEEDRDSETTHADRSDGDDISWEPPIAFSSRNPPPFPEDLLPGFLGDQVRWTARATETPIELGAMLGLAVASASIAGCVEVSAEPGYTEPVNIYTAPTMESGNRKTRVLNAMLQPFLDFEKAEVDRLAPEIARLTGKRKTLEAQIEKMRREAAKSPRDDTISKIEELEANLPVVPARPRLWTQDVTPEQLAVMMAEQGERIAIFSDEGGIFDLLAGRYSKGVPNLDLFLQAHAGMPIRVDRKSGPPVFMHHPTLMVGISPQPDVLQALKDKPGFRGRGLLARFLYALPASPLGYRSLTPLPVPADVTTAYHHGIRALLLRKDPVRLVLGQGAYASWKEFQRGTEVMMRDGGILYHLRDWGSKLPGAALRVAGILHSVLSVGDQRGATIEDDAMEPSLRLATLLIGHALAVFDLMQRDNVVDDAVSVLGWLRENKKSAFTQRECFCARQSRFGRVDALQPALALLEQHRFIKPAQKDKVSHRPSRKYLVNPAVHRAGQ